MKKNILNEDKFAETINKASKGKIKKETAIICAKEINKIDSKTFEKDMTFDPDTCIRFYEDWWNIFKIKKGVSKSDCEMMDCLLSEFRSEKIENALRKRTEEENGSVGFRTFYKDRQRKQKK
jgi:hypothetical protein